MNKKWINCEGQKTYQILTILQVGPHDGGHIGQRLHSCPHSRTHHVNLLLSPEILKESESSWSAVSLEAEALLVLWTRRLQSVQPQQCKVRKNQFQRVRSRSIRGCYYNFVANVSCWTWNSWRGRSWTSDYEFNGAHANLNRHSRFSVYRGSAYLVGNKNSSTIAQSTSDFMASPAPQWPEPEEPVSSSLANIHHTTGPLAEREPFLAPKRHKRTSPSKFHKFSM